MNNKKQCNIVYFNEEIKTEIFKTIKKYSLQKEFDIAINELKVNPDKGKKISREKYPKKYRNNSNIKNLWKYDVIKRRPGWRLIYTISAGKVKVLAILLELLDHKSYDRLFGYS
jgi:hypothetical protein